MAVKRAVIWAAVSSKVQATDDKISLAYQEEQGRIWAEANGYTVIDVLRVPGHSRREADILTLFEDYDALGVSAYRDIRRYWQSRTLDVLIAYSPDRLGRAQTLVSYVIENVVQSGAVVHLLQGGTIDASNYRMAIAFSGAQAAGEVHKFAERSIAGRKKAIADGKYAAGTVPQWFIPVRDARGVLISLQFNEDYRPLFDTLAELLLEGIPYGKIELELAKRGFTHPTTGKPYVQAFFAAVLRRSTTWGHIRFGDSSKNTRELWQIEEGHPVPAGIVIHYNAHTPVYTGEQAELVLGEIKRRMLKNGRASTKDKWWRGLVYCDVCKYHLVSYDLTTKYNHYEYANCGRTKTAKLNNPIRDKCPAPQTVRVDAIKTYVESLLDELISNERPRLRVITRNDERIDNLKSEAATLDRRIDELVRQAIDAGLSMPAALPNIQREIQRLSLERDTRLADAARLERDYQHQKRQYAAAEVAHRAILDRAAFWAEPPQQINRKLHLIFGD